MRHRKQSSKLGCNSSRFKATVAALVRNLIVRRRIRTTLPKAKIARRVAERMVTLGKKNTLSARRQAISQLMQANAVTVLFAEIAPTFVGRNGGYTRITKLGRRRSDSAEVAILEWVGIVPPKRGKDKEAAAASDTEEKKS